MKYGYLLALVLLIGPTSHAQQTEEVKPAMKIGDTFLAIPGDLARQSFSTARDLITFRDTQWSVLTFAQIGAAIADGKTTLNNFHACPTCKEIGPSQYFIGIHPDAHKFFVAGLVEISVEAMAGRYLRNHGPIRKWYWRLVWTLPQSISLYEHAKAANHNAGLNLGCRSIGANCN